MEPRSTGLLRRIRWANLARLLAVPAAVAGVLAWPHLRADGPSLPPADAAPVVAGTPSVAAPRPRAPARAKRPPARAKRFRPRRAPARARPRRQTAATRRPAPHGRVVVTPRTRTPASPARDVRPAARPHPPPRPAPAPAPRRSAPPLVASTGEFATP